MKKNVLTFFNEPTKKVIPASEVSKNIYDKAECFDCPEDLVKAKLAISNNKQQI